MPCLQKDAVYIHSSMCTYVWGLMRFTVKVAKNYIIFTGYIIMRRFSFTLQYFTAFTLFLYLFMHESNSR